MVLPKSKNAAGLGNSLMNDRFGKGKQSNMHRATAQPGAIKRRDQAGNEYVTNAKKEADWVKMRSITEQGALDEFLSTAELAGTDFTAEKMNNVKIIHTDQKNPYLLSAAEERGVLKKQNAKRARLTVPRRPHWDENTTPQELDEQEKRSLLEWRRGLAELQEVDDLLMTPFERNLEVWRQLWRVIERSDLVVQIVDARNPLLFRCEDLERYVKEADKRKENLLLINKADMMTLEQRQAWAEYFTDKGINFRFFSAELAKEMNEARGNAFEGLEVEGASEGEDEEDESAEAEGDVLHEDDVDEEVVMDGEVEDQTAEETDIGGQSDDEEEWADEESLDGEPERDEVSLSPEEQTRILTTDDLEALFLRHSPPIPDDPDPDAPPRKTQIGLVGYPNVGKSSTINALLGAKKVSVSATPGKTKHFQTIHLSPRVILCDCPGLVFPNFATIKAELVCNGVLPIDQLREYTGPAALVAQRIPKSFLEAVYGMKIVTRPLEEGGTGSPTGEEVLRAYAAARGFYTQGLGQPDESRAARTVLKDYVKGKLLFCHPPPRDPPIDPRHFNRELYDLAHLPSKRRGQLAASAEALLNDNDDASDMGDPDALPRPIPQGAKGRKLDTAFFAPGQGGGRVVQPFHHKYSQQGKELSGRKLKTVTALEKDVDPADLKVLSKRHFKSKREKHRVRNDLRLPTLGENVNVSNGDVEVPPKLLPEFVEEAVGQSGRQYKVQKILQDQGRPHGRVYLATHESCQYVLKEISQDWNLRNGIYHRAAGCPHIRLPVDAVPSKRILVFEYFNEDLLSLAKRTKPPTHIKRILHNTLQGIAALHEKGIIHADIKPNNILVNIRATPTGSEIDRVVLTDLEDAAYLGPDRALQGAALGNWMWRSPEAHVKGPMKHQSDIFSFGIVCIYAMTHTVIFAMKDPAMTDDEKLGMILLRCMSYFVPEGESTFKGLLECLTDDNPERDIFETIEASYGDLPRSPITSWDKEGLDDAFKDLVLRLCKMDPRDRMTAKEALEHRRWAEMKEAGVSPAQHVEVTGMVQGSL